MDRLTIEQMHPIHSGASTRKESGHMQRGVHRSEAISKLLGQYSRFQHPMATQSRITPADQQQLLITDCLSGKGLLESSNDLPIAFRRGLRREGTGIRQHEQKG